MAVALSVLPDWVVFSLDYRTIAMMYDFVLRNYRGGTRWLVGGQVEWRVRDSKK